MRPPLYRIVALSEAVLQGLSQEQLIPFPDFRGIKYEIARRPAGATLRAWAKLEEAERRLLVIRWLIQVSDAAGPQYHILLDDADSAFLLAFEATVQVLKDHFRGRQWSPQFDEWLRMAHEGRDNFVFRGIRTLRHLEAHVRSELPPSTVTIHAVLPGQPRITIQWQLSPLTPADLESLTSPHLTHDELDRWNTLARTAPIDALLEDALRELASIVFLAEKRAIEGAA